MNLLVHYGNIQLFLTFWQAYLMGKEALFKNLMSVYQATILLNLLTIFLIWTMRERRTLSLGLALSSEMILCYWALQIEPSIVWVSLIALVTNTMLLTDLRVQAFNLTACFVFSQQDYLESGVSFLVQMGVSYLVGVKQRSQSDELDELQAQVNSKKSQYNAIDIPIFLIDGSTKILFCNSKAQQFFKEKGQARVTKASSLNALLCAQEQQELRQTLCQCHANARQYQTVALRVSEDSRREGQPSVEMGKTVQKNLSYIAHDYLVFKPQQNEDQHFTFTLKPIKWKQGMRCFIVAITGFSHYLLQSHLLFLLQYTAMNLQTQLQNDHSKWHNLRILNVIKESDLKLLSNAIIEQHFIINWLTLFVLKNPKLNFHLPLVNFKLENLIVAQLEYFAAQHLDRFNQIELYYDESLPENMKGNVQVFNLIVFVFLEVFSSLSNVKSSQRKLAVYCNFQRVAKNNQGYEIEVCMVWANETLFQNTFKKVLNDESVDPSLLVDHNQFYLEALKFMMDSNCFQGELHENSFKMLFSFQLYEQLHTYSKANQGEEQQQRLLVMPQLALSFAREKADRGHYLWKQRTQQNLTINKSEMPSMKMNKSVTPVFFKKFAGGNEIKKPVQPALQHANSTKNIKDEKHQSQVKTKTREKKKSKFNSSRDLAPSLQHQIHLKLEKFKPLIRSQIAQLLQCYVKQDQQVNISFALEQENEDDDEEANTRVTYSDKGGSPVIGQNMFQFQSPQITKDRSRLVQRNVMNCKSKYMASLSKKTGIEIKESDEDSFNSNTDKRRVRREQQLFTQLTRQPSVINTIIKSKTANKSIQEDSLDLQETSIQNSPLPNPINKCRTQSHSKKWSFRQNGSRSSFERSDTILAFLLQKINKQFMISILKRDAFQNKEIQFVSSVKELMQMYVQKQKEGIVFDKIFIDEISYEVCKLIQIIKEIEEKYNKKSCIVLVSSTYIKNADYIIQNIYDEERIKNIILA